jgi:hypothetical protein
MFGSPAAPALKAVLASVCLVLASHCAIAFDRAGTIGRFEILQSDKGAILKLDTATGTLSICREKSVGMACELVADDRAALDREIERLSLENRRLRDRLSDLDARPAPLPQVPPPQAVTPEPPPPVQLPVAPQPIQPLSPVPTVQPPATLEKPRAEKPTLTPEQEHRLDRFMDYSAEALRRFQGLVDELRREWGQERM